VKLTSGQVGHAGALAGVAEGGALAGEARRRTAGVVLIRQRAPVSFAKDPGVRGGVPTLELK
jgi:hypothetical protein